MARSTDFTRGRLRTQEGYDEGLSKFMLNTFNMMGLGMLVTALMTFIITQNDGLMTSLFGLKQTIGADGKTVTSYTYSGWFIVAAITQLGMVIAISWMGLASTMRSSTAFVLFMGYAALTGVTISPVVYAYTEASVAKVFFITASMFGAAALYGATTKADLTKFGNILFMGLIGLLIAMVVNIFFRSPVMDYVISIVAVALFTALTAHDVKDMEKMYNERAAESSYGLAVFSALSLYLNFINMFLHLLRLFGIKKD
jgi:uncharacterized protein